ncbi:MAG TPA: alpha-hydroxy acid oxidase [Gammaproteobacteria bacterium]|nr:alpha-hydroxy acid oxidase [Gammaproteobacteria bacterium]
MSDRRNFLRFLAASPLFTTYSSFSQVLADTSGSVIQDPSEALNVFEMEAAARATVPPAHFGYLASGVDDDGTLRANREGYTRYQIRPRRLVDVSSYDMSAELFGLRSSTPVFLAPLGSCGAFHPDGEVGVARAAREKETAMILSTQASRPIEEVIDARGGPIWFQLYSTNSWSVTEHLVQRAERAGATAIALTVDLPAGRNTETADLLARADARVCESCHVPGRSKPAFEGVDMDGVGLVDASLTWSVVGRLKNLTSLPIIIKGIETREDAVLAVDSGADGVVVSNHGGRATPTGRGTIEALPEVAEAVNGRIPVIVDGGIRRGSDIFKAIALGASAVGIGRPYAWGLGAFGQAGVERVIDILTREFAITMRGSGARSLDEINRDHIIDTQSRR